jgi:hypothetical protein
MATVSYGLHLSYFPMGFRERDAPHSRMMGYRNDDRDNIRAAHRLSQQETMRHALRI